MAKVIRYALAALCFAASFGCLALWAPTAWLGNYVYVEGGCRYLGAMQLEAHTGMAMLTLRGPRSQVPINSGWTFSSKPAYISTVFFKLLHSRRGNFGQEGESYFFPLWYPALVFALAGVAALRYRRQFTIRSAIVATTVVAVLLGIVVAL